MTRFKVKENRARYQYMNMDFTHVKTILLIWTVKKFISSYEKCKEQVSFQTMVVGIPTR